MKVISWSKKLVVNKADSVSSSRKFEKPNVEQSEETKQKHLYQTPLRRGLHSISKVLHPNVKKTLKKTFSQKYVQESFESPILMPLTIKLNSNVKEKHSNLRHRSKTICNRAEIRSMLHERLRQKMYENSMEAVILEAQQELFDENNNNDSIYVSFERERRTESLRTCMSMGSNFSHKNKRFEGNHEEEEEDTYMTMNFIN